MPELIPIKDLVDAALNGFQSNETLDKAQRIFIALRRIRKGFEGSFEDFKELLKKIENADPNFYIFSSYVSFLTEKLDATPWDHMQTMLHENGFDKQTLMSMSITLDEKANINRLPKKVKAIYICIFFLLKPRLTYKFFMEYLCVPHSADEEKLLTNFRKLSPKNQSRFLDAIKEVVLNNFSKSSQDNT